MQVIAISAQPDLRAKQLLEQHHRLRARVFSDRLGWAVCVLDGLESDAFDDLEPTSSLSRTAAGSQDAPGSFRQSAQQWWLRSSPHFSRTDG